MKPSSSKIGVDGFTTDTVTCPFSNTGFTTDTEWFHHRYRLVPAETPRSGDLGDLQGRPIRPSSQLSLFGSRAE